MAQPNLAPRLVGSAQVSSHPITSPKGFALAMQAVRDNVKKLFKPEPDTGASISQTNPIAPPLAGTGQPGVDDHDTKKDGLLDSPQTKKEIKTAAHWFKKTCEKAGHWFVKIFWHWIIKNEHKACKKLAHAIISSRASSHSRSSGSSGHSSRSQKSGSFYKGLMTLFLTVLHAAVYGLLQYGLLLMLATFLVFPFAPWLKPWLEFPFRFAAHLAVYGFPALVWAGLHNYLAPTLVIIALLAIGGYFAWKAEPLRISLLSAALAYLFIHGRGWAEQTLPLSPTVVSKPQVVSAPAMAPQVIRSLKLGSSKLKTSNSKLKTADSTPEASYQPAVAFIPNPSSPKTLYDPKILELEIASLPKNSIVKDFPLTPDEGMPLDVASSRMQDVIDPDKYTMYIGSSKEIIQSVNAGNTTLTIIFKSADPLDFWGGKGPMNFLWEDAKYIHADEIDIISPNKPTQINANGNNGPLAQPSLAPQFVTSAQVYQCSLVVSGSKFPLTIQCATPEDLEHLVSTLQYFIRHSRLGRDTAMGGMPYPDQGIRFNNDRVVSLLWADSPMDKSNVSLGDHLWSVGKITSEQQSRKDLEAGLSPNRLGNLSALPSALYVASPSEWEKALRIARQPGAAIAFQPKLRKVILSASQNK